MSDNIKQIKRDGLTPVEQQAIYWIERTEKDDFTVEESKAFHAWLDASKDHEVAFDDLLSVVSGVRVLGRRAKRKSLFSRAVPVPQIAAIAAALMAMIGVGLWAVSYDPATEMRYATAVGERKTVTLEDGTLVTLNTASEIRVRYSKRLRRVDVVRGQGSFDIVPDADRPFQTYTDDAMIMALGTVYDVFRGEDDSIFTLIEGKAIVGTTAATASWRDWAPDEAAESVVTLAPGERVTATGDQSLDESLERLANIDHASLWQEGVVILSQSRLADAFQELNRYSKIKLTVADDPALNELRISGRFKVTGDGAAEAIADHLKIAFPVTADRVTQNEIRFEARDGDLH